MASLGWDIGLPLALKFWESFDVTGIDIKADIIDQLLKGESTVEGISNERVKNAVEADRGLKLLVVDEEPSKTNTDTLEKLLGISVFVVCVPTPLREGNGWAPDLDYITKAQELIRVISRVEADRNLLTQERLIILESTTYPGTTREIFAPLLDEFREAVSQWYLAYVPERISPGSNAYDETGPVISGKERGAYNITRVIGGLDSASLGAAAALYKGNVCREIRFVSSLEAAEMVKLVENTFRFVAIGFSNELSRIARTFGLNVWELIDAVKTKDFGLDICYPGLIGGHCLPIDAHYLGWALRQRRYIASFVDVAEKAHQDMRQDAFDLIQSLLNRNNRGVANSNILFFGISYKKNVGDIRESAAIDLIKKLYSANANVAFWDPVRSKHSLRLCPQIAFSDSECELLSEKSSAAMFVNSKTGQRYFQPEELKSTWEELRYRIVGSEFHCIVLAADHDEFRQAYGDLVLTQDAPSIADLSNCIPNWFNALPAGPEKDRIQSLLRQPGRYTLLGVD